MMKRRVQPRQRRRAAAIDAMLRDPDPRTAIVGAYGSLLTDVAARGAARRNYEGPLEHLARVLHSLRVPRQPTETLVHLFGIARFSTQPLTSIDREHALQSLHDISASLVPVNSGEPAA